MVTQVIRRFWNFLTPTKAIERCGGYYEKMYFESVLRMKYFSGLSDQDNGLYLIYNVIVKLLILSFLGSEVWYLFSQSSSLDRVIDNINLLIIHLVGVYRSRIMVKNDKILFSKLRQAMDIGMLDVATEQRKKILYFWFQRSEIYSWLLLLLGICTLSVWYIYPLVDDLEYNLPVAIRVPVAYDNPAMYPIVYVWVLAGFHSTSCFVMTNDVTIQVLFMQILCQFNVLGDCFENLLSDCVANEINHCYIECKDKDFQKKYLNRLDSLIKQHQFITDNCMEMKRILSVPLLYQFCASGLLICFAAYQITVTISISLTKFFMSVLYLGYNMFQLFIFCRWCDEIRVQSESIRDTVYCNGWEKGGMNIPGVGRRLLLVMMRASRPVGMSAGGLYGLTLESYAAVIKNSYTALTILLRFR